MFFVLLLLVIILRKDTTHEDVKRERERKLGDSTEGKTRFSNLVIPTCEVGIPLMLKSMGVNPGVGGMGVVYLPLFLGGGVCNACIV